MSIMELGALGEFVGSIGVVATLGLPGGTDSPEYTRDAFCFASCNHGLSQPGEYCCGPERGGVTGCVDRTSLTETERERLDSLLRAHFHVFDSLFYSANTGTGERSLLLAEEKGFSHLMNLQGVYDWWKDNPYAFSPEFRSYMEDFRATVGESGSDE